MTRESQNEVQDAVHPASTASQKIKKLSEFGSQLREKQKLSKKLISKISAQRTYELMTCGGLPTQLCSAEDHAQALYSS
jgi:hypothetical protein